MVDQDRPAGFSEAVKRSTGIFDGIQAFRINPGVSSLFKRHSIPERVTDAFFAWSHSFTGPEQMYRNNEAGKIENIARGVLGLGDFAITGLVFIAASLETGDVRIGFGIALGTKTLLNLGGHLGNIALDRLLYRLGKSSTRDTYYLRENNLRLMEQHIDQVFRS